MKLGVLNFLGDIKNFLKGGKVLGVDIGSTSIKAVEIAKVGDRFKLINYGILETKSYLDNPTKVLQTGSLKMVDKEAANLLKCLFREMKTKTKLALFSLPSFSVFVTPLEMPVLTPLETQKAVGFQARQFIPLPIDQVSIDWTKIDEYENERGQRYQRVLLIGIPNEVLETYKRIAKMAGLRLVFLELETLALIRSLYAMNNQVVITVDIGTETTTTTISDQGTLKYSSTGDHGGYYLTQALVRSLGISAARAEDLKRRRGLLGTGGDAELSTLLLSFLDVIIDEVSSVRELYERRYGKKAQRIVLAGGGANLAGIDKYVSERLGLEVYHPSVFMDIEYESGLEPIMKNLTNELAVAVGVAKRYFN